MDDKLKNLPPEERIKKLKELEEKKKKEIAEAEKLIKESEKEMTGRDEWLRKVPIPEVGKEDFIGLGVEGKELLKVHRGVSEKVETEENPEEINKRATKEQDSLEETISHEEIKPIQDVQYDISHEQLNLIYKLSEEPVAHLYTEMRDLNSQVEEKGYATREEVDRAQAIGSALEKRIDTAYSGTPTEEVAARTQSTAQMSREVLNMYKGGAGKDKPQNAYQSGGKTNELYK